MSITRAPLLLSLILATLPFQVSADCQLPTNIKKSAWLSPTELNGDFTGDSIPDSAFLIKSSNSKVGIAFCDGKTSTLLGIAGAGKALGNGSDDFSWMDHWDLQPKKGKADRDAIFVEKTESASALIFWNGQKLVWIQQGD
jgi:hypothetical protein